MEESMEGRVRDRSMNPGAGSIDKYENEFERNQYARGGIGRYENIQVYAKHQ